MSRPWEHIYVRIMPMARGLFHGSFFHDPFSTISLIATFVQNLKGGVFSNEHIYQKPVEMPRGTHYGNNYWIFQSRKVGRNVTAFSNLEHDNLVTLEMNPEVEWYCEQPEKTTVFYDGTRAET